MKEANVLAIFTLAGLEVLETTQIENGYWPGAYAELREANPWWKVLTPVGTIVIGKRKRVFNIDWTDTSVRAVVTDDHVTKSETNVHAWSVGKAVDYLAALRLRIDQAAAKAAEDAEHVND